MEFCELSQFAASFGSSQFEKVTRTKYVEKQVNTNHKQINHQQLSKTAFLINRSIEQQLQKKNSRQYCKILKSLTTINTRNSSYASSLLSVKGKLSSSTKTSKINKFSQQPLIALFLKLCSRAQKSSAGNCSWHQRVHFIPANTRRSHRLRCARRRWKEQ